MKVTFLGHSGFAVQAGSLLLIFDYETGTLPLEDGIDRLIFFVSHRHQDHFNPAIFYPEGWNGQTEYVLSKDVRKAIRRLEGVPEERCRWMAAGEELRLTSGDGADGREQRERDGQSVRVRTLRSTDCGVAFLVSLEEGQIYHAGDLNCWTWPEDTKQHRNQMVAEYQREIRRLQGEQIRLAFCPLDPRLEENYADGFLWFLEHVDADYVWPMHMWEEYGMADRLLATMENEALKKKVMRISRAGQQWEI